MPSHLRTLTLVLVAAAVLVPTLSAFEFDEAQWTRDARNLARFEKLSQTMRENFRSFAASKGTAKTITSEEHVLADKTVAAYARIRNYLAETVERWDGALPARSSVADELDGRLKGTVLALAASAVMLENAACMVECFKGTVWEGRLNEGDQGRSKWNVAGLFRDVAKSLGARANRAHLIDAVAFLDTNSDRVEELASADPTLAALLSTAQESSTLGKIRDEDSIDRVQSGVVSTFGKLGSALKSGINATMGRISKVFGNAVGSIHIGEATVTGEVRQRVHDEMIPLLQPGDILLDKTRFALTDRFIPGHFGHVAMWLGTVEDLEGFGVFDVKTNKLSSDKARQYQEQIADGHCVLEALRPGVQVNSLEHFLNVDEVAVLRFKQRGTPEQHREFIRYAITRGLFHLGQDYDFNFDVNTSNTIVCSELVYQAFPAEVEWPTESAMGRPTISPDNVATLAGPDDAFPLEVVYYHADGQSYSGPEAWRGFWTAMRIDGKVAEPLTDFTTKLRSAIDQLEP